MLGNGNGVFPTAGAGAGDVGFVPFVATVAFVVFVVSVLLLASGIRLTTGTNTEVLLSDKATAK
jgi:hypothetical protein